MFAHRLLGNKVIDQVLHPCLPSCPGHEIWARDIKRSSGVFSLVLKPGAEARLDAALTALKVFSIGASWGGTRSLLATMAVKADRSARPWMHNGAVIRISVGLEEEEELWRDLECMLRSLKSCERSKAADRSLAVADPL
jgi:cystathionine beta-lyase